MSQSLPTQSSECSIGRVKLLPPHPRPNLATYWVSNDPLASGALSLLQIPPLPILQNVEGNYKGQPLLDRRLPQREIPASAGGRRRKRKRDQGVRRREEISRLPSPFFRLPSLPLGPFHHPLHPNFEGLPLFFPVQHQLFLVLFAPLPHSVSVQESECSPPSREEANQGGMLQTLQESCHICSLPPLESTCWKARAPHTPSCSACPEKIYLDVVGTVSESPSAHPLRPSITLLQLCDPPTLPRHTLGSATDRRMHTRSQRPRAGSARGGSTVCARGCGSGQLGKKVLLSRPVNVPTTSGRVHQSRSPYLGPEAPGARWSGPHCSQLEGAPLQPASSHSAPPRPPRVFAQRQSRLFQVSI